MQRFSVLTEPVPLLSFVPSFDASPKPTGCGENDPSPSFPRLSPPQPSNPSHNPHSFTNCPGFPVLSIKPEPHPCLKQETLPPFSLTLPEGVPVPELRVFAKKPLQKAVAQQAKGSPFTGQSKYWTRFYKSRTEYLRKMNVDVD